MFRSLIERALAHSSPIRHRESSRSRGEARGFTLMELIVVVTIVAILATVATYSVRQYILHAKTIEAREVIASIGAGQEAYYDETFRYLNISSGANWYPQSDHDGTVKTQWGAARSCGAAGDCAELFGTLGVFPTAPVLFDYQTTADNVGSTALSTMFIEAPSGVAGPLRPHYVVEAVAAMDGNVSDGMTIFTSTSQSTEIGESNVGE